MKRSFVLALASLGCTLTPALASAASPKGVIAAYAQQAGISEQEAKKNFDGVILALRQELIADREVTIQNFGKFHIEERGPRVARNPKTGQMLQIGARRYPRFSGADKLKSDMNPTAQSETKALDLPTELSLKQEGSQPSAAPQG